MNPRQSFTWCGTRLPPFSLTTPPPRNGVPFHCNLARGTCRCPASNFGTAYMDMGCGACYMGAKDGAPYRGPRKPSAQLQREARRAPCGPRPARIPAANAATRPCVPRLPAVQAATRGCGPVARTSPLRRSRWRATRSHGAATSTRARAACVGLVVVSTGAAALARRDRGPARGDVHGGGLRGARRAAVRPLQERRLLLGRGGRACAGCLATTSDSIRPAGHDRY